MTLECPFYLELERRTNATAVADKLQRYSGRWLRILESHGRFEARPILVVHYDTRPAKKRRSGSGASALRETLSALLYGDADGHFDALNVRLRERYEYADVGRLVATCSWEELYARGVFGAHYYPLGGHDPDDYGVEEQGKRITLYALARERERLLAAYRKAAAGTGDGAVVGNGPPATPLRRSRNGADGL